MLSTVCSILTLCVLYVQDHQFLPVFILSLCFLPVGSV